MKTKDLEDTAETKNPDNLPSLASEQKDEIRDYTLQDNELSNGIPNKIEIKENLE